MVAKRVRRRRRGGRRRSGDIKRPADDQAEQRPLLHRLGAAAARHADRRDQRADRRLDDARSRHAGAADRAINANAPAGRAGRAGRARPRRRGAGDGRRPRLCRFDLQPRDPGRAPAGIRVQAVRLSRRARIRDEADRHDRRRAGHDRRLDARATRPATHLGPVTLREAFARSINTISAKIGAAARLRHHRRHGAAVRHQRPNFDLSRRWCSAPAMSG